MQILVTFLCLLLITTGSSLDCEVCSALGSTCAGSWQICEDGQDTCVINRAENSLAGYPVLTVYKGCASSDICDQGPQYVHLGEGREIRSITACCVGDACRTTDPLLPPAFVEPNGKRCPACYAVSPNTCNPKKIVKCVGPEEHCLDLAMTITHGSLVINAAQKGCATKLACDQTARGDIDTSRFQVHITKAACQAAPAAD
ncbi:phospholipase A2 inhibitor and Ly6/PLAUR domain-containing protein-like [Varanus komodoensis]|uniref:Sodefrin-like factor n=1 Tax=Varanus komodoensis TaxID=61221 RepID=A0A8D2J1Y2_VARKO|nr:phospholipase A2 inhibitor and Ly6/PLAUR domain-containing protein-like [Varanus komodoensis]